MALETLAAQVSIAIENARLWNQAQRRLLEQGIVHQIGQDLTSILDYNELVSAVVQHMTRAMDTSLCILTSYDGENNKHSVEAEYRVGELTRNPDRYPLPPFMGQPLAEHEQSLVDHQRGQRTALSDSDQQRQDQPARGVHVRHAGEPACPGQ